MSSVLHLSSSRASTPGFIPLSRQPLPIPIKPYARLGSLEKDDAFEAEVLQRENAKKNANTDHKLYKGSVRTQEEELYKRIIPGLNWANTQECKDFVAKLDEGSISHQEVEDTLARHPYWVNAGDGNGVTPFMSALFSNQPKVVKAFLDSGAIEAEHWDKDGSHALHWLAQPPTTAEISAKAKEAVKGLLPAEAKAKRRLVTTNMSQEYASNLIKIVEMLKPIIEANRSVFAQKNNLDKSVSDYVDSYMTNKITREQLSSVQQYFAKLEVEEKAEQRAAKKAISILNLPSSGNVQESLPEKLGRQKRKAVPDSAPLPNQSKRARTTQPAAVEDNLSDTSTDAGSGDDFATGRGSRKKQNHNPFAEKGYVKKKRTAKKR